MISFENIAQQVGIPVLQITKDRIVLAKGIHIPETIASLCDDNTSTISYPDTGIFILFKGSHVFSAADRYEQYTDENHRTNREIVFQSRNAAAQFVLGETGRTNNWQQQD